MRNITPYLGHKVAVCVAILLSFCTSCNKFMNIPPPINKVSTTDVFNDSVSATSAAVYLYTSMGANPSLDNYITYSTGVESDELSYTSTSTTYIQFLQNDVQIDNSNPNSVWVSAYSLIYDANLMIEKLSKTTSLSVEYKNQLTGEAKFVRALMHFYLVNLFGEVPLITTTDYRVNATKGRNSELEVNSQIIQDLKDAINNMGTSYIMIDKVRPNKLTAMALLARVYLYNKDWVNAELMSTNVIGAGKYSLPILSDAFLKTSVETIWQLYPTQNLYNTPEANTFIPSTSATTKPQFPLTTSLYGSFEIGDQRKTSWVSSKLVSGITYYYPYKYKVKTGTNTTATEYPIMLRLGEQYLIRAEARANRNDITGALSDLNVIRVRAKLTANTTANTQALVLAAIEQERRVELFAERGGHRWLDLKRTNKANTILSVYKGTTWQSTDTLWPIPSAQRSLNIALSQNNGY